MNTKFFKWNMNTVRIVGSFFVLVSFLFFSSCFNLSNQNPCDCAVNNAVANTPSFNAELGQKCDEHESSLSESERAEWQREMAACQVRR